MSSGGRPRLPHDDANATERTREPTEETVMADSTVLTESTTRTAPGSARDTARTARRTPGGRARTAVLALQILLALFYSLASAAPKLLGASAAADSFDKIGFGDWFMYLTGSLELAGGIALVIPVLYQVSAIALCGLMVCAAITQFTVFDGHNAATPLVLLVPLAFIAWFRRDSTPALLALLRRATA
jgi:uncharacterized membrane protein YphA (DoxX/SURF4 family)